MAKGDDLFCCLCPHLLPINERINSNGWSVVLGNWDLHGFGKEVSMFMNDENGENLEFGFSKPKT
jgi:hypothetical protein